MIGSTSSRVERRPPVATLTPSASQRGRNTQRGSPSDLYGISPKLCNFKLTKVSSFKLTLTRWTSCARAQVGTLRLRLLKLGAWIETSVRRIVIHLPLDTPFADDWRRIARSVGAVVT